MSKNKSLIKTNELQVGLRYHKPFSKKFKVLEIKKVTNGNLYTIWDQLTVDSISEYQLKPFVKAAKPGKRDYNETKKC